MGELFFHLRARVLSALRLNLFSPKRYGSQAQRSVSVRRSRNFQKVKKISCFNYGFLQPGRFVCDETVKKEKKARSSRLRVGQIKPAGGNFFKAVIAFCVAIAVSVAPLHAEQNTQQRYDFDIPQMPVADALNEFSEQTGAVLLFPYELVEGRSAKRLVGEYGLTEALEILLDGSGLSGGLVQSEVIRISLRTEITETIREETAVNNQVKRSLLASAAALVFGGGATGVAAAQNESGEDQVSVQDTIIVTSTRREENLQNVPMAVTVQSPADFVSVGLTDLDAVVDYTPGISVFDTGGTVAGRFYVARGVGPDASGEGAPTVGVYLDGATLSSTSPIGRGSGFVFDGLLVDVERIEFLKGPQGTLYGAGAMGGAIRYITRKPALDVVNGLVAVDLSTTKDGGDSQLYNARVSLPIVKDRLGLTLAGYSESNGGFTDQMDPAASTILAEDTDAFDRYGYSADLYLKVSDRLDIRGRVLHQEVDQPVSTREELSPGTTDPLFVPNANLLTDGPGQAFTVDSTMYSIEVSHQFDGVTLTATSGYFEAAQGVMLDIATTSGASADSLIGRPAGTTTAFVVDADAGYERWSHELQLASDGDRVLEWVAGLYYADEQGFSTDLLTVEPGAFTFSDARNPADFSEIAGFGNLTYNISEKFDVTVGARLSRSEFIYSPSNFSDIPLIAEDVSFSSDTDETVATYSFAARYRPYESHSLYARVASGFRAGYVDIDTGGGGVSTVDPDEIWSYELGAKGDLVEGFASYELALWYLDWDNFQAVIPSAIGVLNSNATGGVAGKGFEATLVLSPFDGLTLNSNVAYTNVELKEDEPGLFGAEGQRLPRVPEWTASSRLNYSAPLDEGRALNLGVGVRYESSSDSTFGGGGFINLPSDELIAVDANIGVDFDEFTVGLYATNLTNERVIRSTLEGFGQTRGVPLRPRTVGVRLAADF